MGKGAKMNTLFQPTFGNRPVQYIGRDGVIEQFMEGLSEPVALGNAFTDLLYKEIGFEQFIEIVRRWYAGIPYSITDRNQNGRSSECHQACLNGRVVTDEDEVNEQLYQSLIYAALMAFGADVSAEDQTSDGRMDIALKVADAIYILELKYDKTAEEATDQIIAKDYAVRFAADTRPVYAVGLNISEDRRTIDSYKIVKVR